jgi:hypothetical protein
LPERLNFSSCPPLPCSSTFFASAGSFFHGVEREKPMTLARVSIIFTRQDLAPSGYGARAPEVRERSGSGTTLSGSTPIRVPSPEQVGQAP